MDDGAPLKTLLDLAQHLGVTSAKSGRRAMYQAMQNDPGLQVTKRGRTILFTPEQFARTIKALEWSPHSAMRAARRSYATTAKASSRSAQEVVAERMRNLLSKRR